MAPRWSQEAHFELCWALVARQHDPSKPQQQDPSTPQQHHPSKPQQQDPSKPQHQDPSKPQHHNPGELQQHNPWAMPACLGAMPAALGAMPMSGTMYTHTMYLRWVQCPLTRVQRPRVWVQGPQLWVQCPFPVQCPQKQHVQTDCHSNLGFKLSATYFQHAR